MAKVIKHQFYTDGGHGWLKVPLTRLKKLGIAEKITGYSYMLTSNAYLEEDCDLSTYVKVLQEKAGLDPEDSTSDENRAWLQSFWENVTTNETRGGRTGCAVRKYPGYEYITDEQQSILEDIRSAVLVEQNWGRSAINTIKKAGKKELLHWNTHYKLGFDYNRTLSLQS